MTEDLINEVNTIIAYSQDFPFDTNCSNLLKKWEKAKRPFIEVFDGQLLVRSPRPIKITLSEEQQSRKFQDFIHTLDDNAVLTEELKQFLNQNEKGFFDNRVIAPFPAKNIQRGAKLSRTFRKFVSDFPEVRWIQDTASQYIQENKVEGYLYLSVDPRDFLTMSETNANWSSCHSLDGDYRAGNLNYMVDDVTMVAYLASDKQEKLRCMPEGLTWNSKKWRMLVHITDNCIYYNKQYPFFSENLLRETYNLILEYFGHYNEPHDYGFKLVQGQLGSRRTLEYNQLAIDGIVVDTREVIDTKDYLGFSDLISSSSYAPIVSTDDRYNRPVEWVTRDSTVARAKKRFGIKIGEKAPCVCCGQDTIHRDNSFLCPDCMILNNADDDFFIRCDECGHRIYPDEEIFWENNMIPYCKTCYSLKGEN